MYLFIFLFTIVLFYILTPGIFISLPPKASKNIVNITHAFLFSFIWTLSHKAVWDWGMKNGWINFKKEAMTLRQCNNKNGRYEDGYCYDENNELIN